MSYFLICRRSPHPEYDQCRTCCLETATKQSRQPRSDALKELVATTEEREENAKEEKFEARQYATQSQGRAIIQDSLRELRVLVAREGESQCPVPHFRDDGEEKSKAKDGSSKPELHYARHGRNKFSVLDCKNFVQEIISSRDEFGEPWPRCKCHGANRCSVLGCAKNWRGVVHIKDEFGEPGWRCVRHGGGKRCSVQDCKTSSRGEVSSKDEFGKPRGAAQDMVEESDSPSENAKTAQREK